MYGRFELIYGPDNIGLHVGYLSNFHVDVIGKDGIRMDSEVTKYGTIDNKSFLKNTPVIIKN